MYPTQKWKHIDILSYSHTYEQTKREQFDRWTCLLELVILSDSLIDVEISFSDDSICCESCRKAYHKGMLVLPTLVSLMKAGLTLSMLIVPIHCVCWLRWLAIKHFKYMVDSIMLTEYADHKSLVKALAPSGDRCSTHGIHLVFISHFTPDI